MLRKLKSLSKITQLVNGVSGIKLLKPALRTLVHNHHSILTVEVN